VKRYAFAVETYQQSRYVPKTENNNNNYLKEAVMSNTQVIH